MLGVDVMADGEAWQALCPSASLVERGLAFPFDVCYLGQVLRAFAVRYEHKAYAYLNRCTHVPMELDWQPNRVFDASGHWLLCASHGASYSPANGACLSGPCRGGLISVALREEAGWVQWQPSERLRPVVFSV